MGKTHRTRAAIANRGMNARSKGMLQKTGPVSRPTPLR